MSHFVNHDRDQAVLSSLAIRAVLFRARTVEANHRVFHAVDRTIDRYRDGVGVGERVARIDVQRVDDRVCRVLTPKRLSLIRIVRHSHHLIAFDIVALSVPDKLARRGKGKVSHLVSFEDPRLLPLWFCRLICLGFFGSHNEGRFLGRLGRPQPLALFLGQHLLFVEQDARGSDHMIVGRRDANQVVAHF